MSLPRNELLLSLPLFLSVVSVTNAAISKSAITLKTIAAVLPFPVLCDAVPPPLRLGSGLSVGIGPGISTGPTSAGRLVGRGVGRADGRADGDIEGAGAAVFVGRIVFLGAVVGRGVTTRGVDAGRAVTVGRCVAAGRVVAAPDDVPEFVWLCDGAGEGVGTAREIVSPASSLKNAVRPCLKPRWLASAQSAYDVDSPSDFISSYENPPSLFLYDISPSRALPSLAEK